MRSAISSSSGSRYLCFGFPSYRVAVGSTCCCSHPMSLVPYFELIVLRWVNFPFSMSRTPRRSFFVTLALVVTYLFDNLPQPFDFDQFIHAEPLKISR